MSDDKELPEKLTSYQHCLDAARQGMRLKAIAARAGMTLAQFNVYLVATPQFAIDLELEYAAFEEEKRKRIDAIESEAITKGELSLQYKINREAIKELTDRDNSVKVMQVNVSQDSGLVEPEYVEHSEEELAAIRARTESESDGDE